MRYSFVPAVVAAMAGFVLFPVTSHADTIVNPISATASTTFGAANVSGPINGSGLSNPSLVANGVTVPAVYPTNSVYNSGTNFNNNWLEDSFNGDSVGNATWTAQLVAGNAPLVNISGMHFWQYGNDVPARSVKTLDVLGSPDGITFTPVASLTGFTVENNTGATDATPNQDPGQNFSFSATGVRYIKFQNFTSYGDNFVGFGEVRFFQPTPEPGSLGLLGLGGTGLLARRRRPA